VYRRSGGWAFRVDVAADPEAGARRQRSRQGFATKAEAVAALAEVIAETEPPAWGRVYGVTVRQAAQSWLDRKADDCAVSTAVTYRRLVAKICDGLGDVVVGELSVAMVDEFERGLLDRGARDGGALSAKSVLAVHAVLHQILDDAVRRGVVTANVAASASPPRHEAAVVTVWTNDEVRRFLEFARSHRLFGAFVVLLATGLTRGELVGLRWNDVDLDAGTIVVRRVVSMTLGQRTESIVSTPRTVTFGEHTIDVLQQHRATSDQPGHDWPVFQKRGGGELNPESMSTTFARLVERAGVTPITIGGLRHTHAAMALKAGVNPLVVSKRLGHSTSAFTHDLYRHLIPPLHDDNLEAFEAALFERTS